MDSSSSMEKNASSVSTVNESVKNNESFAYPRNDEAAPPPNAFFNSSSQIYPKYYK